MDATSESFISELLTNSEICKNLLILQAHCESKPQAQIQDECLSLAIGDTVNLHSLANRSDLNGKSAVILRENDDKSRWIVRLQDLEQEIALKPDNLRKQPVVQTEDMADGDLVAVHGLVGSPELNGSVGIILREDASRGRWIVQFRDCGKEKALLSTNLKKCSSLPSDIWMCSEDGAEALRIVGRTRSPLEHEKGFRAVVEIACRGSQNIENWITNFTASLQQFDTDASRGRVHKGFYAAYDSLRKPMLANIKESLTKYSTITHDSQHNHLPILVYVVGHSLGGALATLAAFDLATSEEAYSVRCVTWGSPRVGDAEFVKAYKTAVPLTIRFVNSSDAVPRVPVNPDDPNDDGAAVGNRVSQWLHMLHAKVDAHEYMHVCCSTRLSDSSITGSGDALTRALDGFNTLFENGMGSGFKSLFETHFMKSYLKTTITFLDGGSVDPSPEVPIVNASETGEKAAKAMANLFVGASKAYGAFKRFQDDYKSSSSSKG